MERKLVLVTVILCLLCGLFHVETAKADTDDLVIVLDPGHDSKHGGAGGNGLREEQINMKIAQYVYEELREYKDVTVYMTHNTMACPFPDKNSRDDNIGRIRYAKSVNADVVISLHNNSSTDSSVRGAGVYYPNTNYHYDHYTLGKGLAQSIQNELLAIGLQDRGIVYKNSQDNTRYPDGSLADYYRVINEGKLQDVPTIIVEHAFISNASDAKNFLSTDEQLKALAMADVAGIVKYFNLSKGWFKEGDKWYYMKPGGAMATGWLYDGGEWYYLRSGGAMATGWVYDNGTWYYMKSNGVMAKFWVYDANTWYYMKSNGAMATGWIKDADTWYYMRSNGAMAKGWVKDADTWYYMRSNGAMATGWVKDADTWYYMKSNGAMATGWLKDDDVWYYLKSNGAMATGWLQDGDTWYYLQPNGAMAADTWIGNYYVNASGAWVV